MGKMLQEKSGETLQGHTGEKATTEPKDNPEVKMSRQV
jgi:hypothetical protein